MGPAQFAPLDLHQLLQILFSKYDRFVATCELDCFIIDT